MIKKLNNEDYCDKYKIKENDKINSSTYQKKVVI